jgi:hypothetical protein
VWLTFKKCDGTTKTAVGRGTSFVIGCGWSDRNTGQEPDKRLWQFRLRPLVLHSYSCGCPPHLYLVTAESAVAAPAGDLLSIGCPRGSDACHATEVAYTPIESIGRPQCRIGILLIGHRGGRRPGHDLTQLAGRWVLRAAFPNGCKLYTVSVCCG